jgi:hypothetical protein
MLKHIFNYLSDAECIPCFEPSNRKPKVLSFPKNRDKKGAILKKIIESKTSDSFNPPRFLAAPSSFARKNKKSHRLPLVVFLPIKDLPLRNFTHQ